MNDHCSGAARRSRKIKRALMFFILVITLIILHHAIDAEMSEIPDKKVHFHSRKHAEAHRVLEELHTTSTSNNYNALDINKILMDEEESGGSEPDPDHPYTLGPKISDWDEQRAKWLKENPDYPNFLGPNKPRVMLVTGSSPKPCKLIMGNHFLVKSIKNKIDYCRLHKFQIFYNMAILDAEMDDVWFKLPLLRKLILSHPDVEFFMYMDSDAMFTDMAFEIPWERYSSSNLVVHGWDNDVYNLKRWVGLNAGIFLLRNCQWSLDFLDAWSSMGIKGKVREESGKIICQEIKDRPVFEADDQASMVYILATQREKWGDKVYLESAYFLHGYWEILVDKYEEMIQNYHPGLGDDRWPFVTHFVGCKPCSVLRDYSVERCFKQMDRAFNLADNQILGIYGFMHKSLESKFVKRVRNETSNNSLEVKDELGLLYSALNLSSS